MKTLLTLMAAALLALGAHAQDWPTKTITLVVPYPPGGNVDVAARIVAGELQKQLKHSVVVENKAGAGGMIAGEAVAKSAPDGHTVFFGANGPILFSPAIFGRSPYTWQKDFAPVTTVSMTPLVLQVHPSTPYKTARELIEAAKARPGEITMASPGAGTTNHLISELVQNRTGARWTTVHYRGNAPATTDLLGGQVQFNFDQLTVAQQHIKQGRLRGLAVTSATRLPALPDLPTMEEAGYKGMGGTTFTGMLVPIATPAAIVNQLSGLVNKILLDKSVMDRFEAAGSQAQGMTPGDFSDYLKKEEALWLPIIKSAQIKAD
jgi:tripartite-type tricarboxylate transporter receptor subunit TctC